MRSQRRNLESEGKKINIVKVLIVIILLIAVIVSIYFIVKKLNNNDNNNNPEDSLVVENEKETPKTIEEIVAEFGGEIVEQVKPDTYYITKDGAEYTAYLDGEIATGRIIPWDGTSAKPAIDEAGNINIYKAEELKWVADQVISGEMNFNGVTITLRNNIDLGARKNDDGVWSGNIWTPVIGFLDELPPKEDSNTSSENTAVTEETIEVDENVDVTNENLKRFAGVLDGNGCSIRGMNVENDKRYQGLFGYSSGVITNLIIKASHINAGEGVGIIVGLNEGRIENCKVQNIEVKGTEKVGTIAGINMTNSSIDGCEILEDKCLVSGDKYVGGISGYTNNNSNISNCINKSNVSGKEYIGGITGITFYGTTITNCYNEALNVIGEQYVGGIAGYSSSQIENSYNQENVNSKGIVSGKNYVGGLVGINQVMGNIVNSYNSGNIIGDKDIIGGIAGENNANISNCYNKGQIDSTKADGIRIGGICGQNSSDSYIYTSYNIGLIKVKNSGNGVIGANFGTISNSFYLDTCIEKVPENDEFKKTENDMKTTIITELGESYVQDENNINNGYPILLWQSSSGDTVNQTEE